MRTIAKIKYNVKGVDPGGDRTLPKAAVHRCKVTSCVLGTNPSDKAQRVEAQYTIMDDDPKGSKGYVMYDYINMEREDLAWKVSQFVKAMGLPESGAFDPEELVGTGLNVRVKIKPETSEYAARAVPGILLPLDDAEGDDDEDLDDDETEAAEAEADDASDDEPYTVEDLNELEKDELFEVADEFELEKPKRLTTAGKTKLIAAILEAQGSDDEDDDESDEEAYEEEELEAMDDDEIKEVLEEFELDASEYETTKKVGKRTKKVFDKDAAIAAILESQEEGDEEAEEETPDYEAMDLVALKALAKERKLDSKGTKKVLVARLTKDDEPF